MDERATLNPLDFPSSLEMPRFALGEDSGWEHLFPFVSLLVELGRPRLIVQAPLSTGGLYLAACQAADSLKLPCRCLGHPPA